MAARHTGTVTWYSADKGYGFIKRDDTSEDIYCHYSAILSDGFHNLEEGERVEFEVKQGHNSARDQARNISAIGGAPLAGSRWDYNCFNSRFPPYILTTLQFS